MVSFLYRIELCTMTKDRDPKRYWGPVESGVHARRARGLTEAGLSNLSAPAIMMRRPAHRKRRSLCRGQAHFAAEFSLLNIRQEQVFTVHPACLVTGKPYLEEIAAPSPQQRHGAA